MIRKNINTVYRLCDMNVISAGITGNDVIMLLQSGIVKAPPMDSQMDMWNSIMFSGILGAI